MIFVILAVLVVFAMYISLLFEKDELSDAQFDEGIKRILEEKP